jgi:HEAT repeats/Putative zinc-finger
MICEQVQELVADYLTGTLSRSEAADLNDHLVSCAACKQEVDALAETWRMLGLLEQEQPGPALRSRFYESLEAYRQGAQSGAPAAPRRRLWDAGARWWGGVPAFQIAWSVALLALGVGLGQWLSNRNHSEGDLARLQDEVHNMRQMVTLSLLEQQSASERLRGVDYAYHVEQSDTQVFSALLHAVNYDPNVNVRLAAVDALRRFGNNPAVRNTLDQSLAKQASPLVQIALIDLIVETRAKSATPALEALERSPAVNKDVKDRAVWGVTQLRY